MSRLAGKNIGKNHLCSWPRTSRLRSDFVIDSAFFFSRNFFFLYPIFPLIVSSLLRKNVMYRMTHKSDNKLKIQYLYSVSIKWTNSFFGDRGELKIFFFIRTKSINTVVSCYVWAAYKNFNFNEMVWTSF
jgi:hypothetical protein